MPISETVRVITEFFDDQLAAGLVLPNGWFGRPYDNLHQLTGCTVAGDTMRIELDGQLILTFAGAGLGRVSQPFWVRFEMIFECLAPSF